MSNSKIYRVWATMHRRCDNTSQESFGLYGARGIKVAPEWASFTVFLNDMGNSYREGLSLDRIDNNGNYSKTNCRWATVKEQAHNRRSNRLLEYKGEIKPLAAWAEEFGLTYSQLKLRLRRGWSVERSLTTGRLVNQFI